MTLTIRPEHARELARLRQHTARPDFVLIGAAALGHHVPLPRKTNDVDLALVVRPDEIEALLTSLGWRRDATIQQRWYGPDDFRADVLPATPELLAVGSVSFDRDTRSMSLVGFDLAFEHAVDVELPGSPSTVKVASLAAIVVLKTVAWLDRPHERTRDLGDLATVFRVALAEDDERRWGTHTVATSGLDFDDQSPFFVGLEVSAIVRPVHRARLDELVAKLLDDGPHAALMARAANLRGEDPDLLARRMVEMFARGLRHADGASR
ncbi:MAG: nucleotidyl transferase AbiEii/AbiGii toxin family protein [Sandaracinus sp.]